MFLTFDATGCHKCFWSVSWTKSFWDGEIFLHLPTINKITSELPVWSFSVLGFLRCLVNASLFFQDWWLMLRFCCFNDINHQRLLLHDRRKCLDLLMKSLTNSWNPEGGWWQSDDWTWHFRGFWHVFPKKKKPEGFEMSIHLRPQKPLPLQVSQACEWDQLGFLSFEMIWWKLFGFTLFVVKWSVSCIICTFSYPTILSYHPTSKLNMAAIYTTTTMNYTTVISFGVSTNNEALNPVNPTPAGTPTSFEPRLLVVSWESRFFFSKDMLVFNFVLDLPFSKYISRLLADLHITIPKSWNRWKMDQEFAI